MDKGYNAMAATSHSTSSTKGISATVAPTSKVAGLFTGLKEGLASLLPVGKSSSEKTSISQGSKSGYGTAAGR